MSDYRGFPIINVVMYIIRQHYTHHREHTLNAHTYTHKTTPVKQTPFFRLLLKKNVKNHHT
jgi:hypothetical protein